MKFPLSLLCCVMLAGGAGAGFGQGAKPPGGAAVSPYDTPATLIREDAATGLELWDTMLGRLWIPRPGFYVIKHLQWEQKIQKVYDHPAVHVKAGDIVIDCGAHIGGFTRVALESGARMVVAIEPERANILALRKNLEAEIKAGRVKIVEKGVWDSTGKLPLHTSDVGDSHSVVVPQNRHQDEVIEVTTLDALAEALKLSRVDFIKMDIEGAERNALRGSRKTLERWHPRLAISSYHLKGDPGVIASLIWECRRDYLIESKDFEKGPDGSAVPKVLFFR